MKKLIKSPKVSHALQQAKQKMMKEKTRIEKKIKRVILFIKAVLKTVPISTSIDNRGEEERTSLG